MPVPDVRTIMLVLILLVIVSFVVLFDLWMRYHKRYRGLDLLFLNFLLVSAALPLLMARGHIPDWISVVASNSMSILGITLGYFGFTRFVGAKIRIWPNLLLVAIFAAVHSWFTWIHPNVEWRSLNVAVASMIIFAQSAWVVMSVPKSFRRITIGVSHVFITFSVVETVRVIKYLSHPLKYTDFFRPDAFESWIMIINMALILMLILSVISMLSRRLLEDIRSEELKFYKVFHSAPFAFVISRYADGLVLDVNEGFCRITGNAGDEVRGKPLKDSIIWENPDDRVAMLKELDEMGRIGPREYQFRDKSGEIRIGLFAVESMIIGNEKCLISSINDITSQVMAQQEVRQLNEELEKRVLERTRELEAFTYSVSHDLRAPLRAIDGFSRIISEEYGERLDSEGNRLFSVIIQNIHKMGRLIDELLRFSRLGRVQLNLTRINMDQLVSSVLEEINIPGTGKKVKLEISGLESCISDWQLMVQVWMNLISNAIKFSSAKDQIEIIISSRKMENNIVYSIRDNGAGFDMKYYGKLFGVFQRLHNESEFEGTGVGLAIVQRIIHLHKGEIWATSSVGEGATFCFSLPR